MNGADFALEVYRNQNEQAFNQSGQLGQNCSQSGQLGQSWQLGTPYWVGTCGHPSSPGDYEIWIQQIGQGEPLLNYGPKLRLIMADPFKGIDLREAIAKLKSALKECKI
jgi:hypothetical protein